MTSKQSPTANPRKGATPRSEGGVAPGKHGPVVEDGNAADAASAKKRAKEADRAGEGGLKPGVHGVMPTDEDVHGLPNGRQT